MPNARPAKRNRRQLLKGLESLEQRRLLTTGAVTGLLESPDGIPEAGALYGYSVASNFSYPVVGAPGQDTQANGTLANAGAGSIAGPFGLNIGAGDQFGYSTASRGGYRAYGAPFHDEGAEDAGSVYLTYQSNNAHLHIDNPEPHAGDQFGMSLAMADDLLVVGAPFDDQGAVDAGTVYVYQYSTLKLLFSIPNPAPERADHFGTSVSATKDRIIVGAPGVDGTSPDSGAVYVFNALDGGLLRTLTLPGATQGAEFGAAVDSYGAHTLIGAPGQEVGGVPVGAAAIIAHDTGVVRFAFSNPSPADGDRFGAALSLSEDTGDAANPYEIAVAAPRDDGAVQDGGAVYLYSYLTGWHQKTLTDPTATAGEQFGFSLSNDGQYGKLNVGAPYKTVAGQVNAGAVLSFDWANFVAVQTANVAPSGGFGRSMAAAGNKLFVGEISGTNSGPNAVYEYDATTKALLHTYHPEPGTRFVGRVLAEGDLMVIDGNVYNSQTHNFIRRIGLDGYETSLIDGLLYDGGDYGATSLKVYDANSGELLRSIVSPTSDVKLFWSTFAIGNDRIYVAGTRQSTNIPALFVLDTNTGELIQEITNPDHLNYGLSGPIAVTNDWIFATSWASSTVLQFRTVDGSYVRTYRSELYNVPGAHASGFGTVIEAHDDLLLVSNLNGAHPAEVQAFDAVSGRQVSILSHPLANGRVRSQGGEYFGADIVVFDGQIAVSDPFRDGIARDMGGVYLYNNDWNRVVLQIDSNQTYYVENEPAAYPLASLTLTDRLGRLGTSPTFSIPSVGFPSDWRSRIVPTGEIATHVSVNAANQIMFDGQQIGQIVSNSQAELTVQFSTDNVAQIESVLKSVAFDAPSERPTSGVRYAKFVLADSSGQITTTSTVQRTLLVVGVPDAPVLNGVPSNLHYLENALPTYLAPDAYWSDIDGGAGSNTIVAAIEGGGFPEDRLSLVSSRFFLVGTSLAYTGANGQLVQVGVVTGGTAGVPLTIRLTSDLGVQDPQSFLRLVGFEARGESPTAGARVVTLKVIDGDGAESVSHSITVNVQTLPDAPSLDIGGPRTYYLHDVPTALVLNPSVGDPDNSEFGGGSLQVQITAGATSDDTLQIQDNPDWDLAVVGDRLQVEGVDVGGWSTDANAHTLTLGLNSAATPSVVEALIRSVTFASANFTGTSQRTVTFKLDDGDGGLVNSVQSLTVTDRNRAPILFPNRLGAMPAIAEDERSSAGMRVSDIIANAINDADFQAKSGLAVYGTSNPNGEWSFSLNGTHWRYIGLTGNSPYLLPATAILRFIPRTNFAGTAGLFVRAWDQTQGLAGGTFNLSAIDSTGGATAFSLNGGMIPITVTPIADAPTDIKLSGTWVVENGNIGAVVGDLSTTDADINDSFTYALVVGIGSVNNSSFEIVGNQLKTKAIYNFETKASYSIRVRSTDRAGLSIDRIFTINVTNLNERPTGLSLSASAVAENKPIGTVVGNFSSTDPDSGNTFTYKLVTGSVANNNGSFQIVGNQLKTKFVFNHEVRPVYNIRVRTTDQNGLSFDKDFSITVTNVNERPTGVKLSANAVAENKPIDTVVGNLSSTDPDSGNTFTYKLVTGSVANNNGSFQIVGNQLKTKFVFNHEVRPVYNLRVRTTDQNGLSFDKDFTINVTNVYEGPTVGGISGSINYVRGAAPLPITTGATLSGGTFAPTKLRVRITDGAAAANVLGFTSSVTVDSSNVVRLGSTIVGTRVSSGIGTNELLINFQSNVTRNVAQQVARALTFKTVAGAVAGPRKVLVSVFDGSLFSPEVSKLVSVS